ncbi:MAG: ATP-binding protein [Candidatus Binatia bacterium]
MANIFSFSQLSGHEIAAVAEALQRINTVINATWDVQSVLRHIVRETVAIFSAQDASVILYDFQCNEAELLTSYGKPEGLQTLRYSLAGSFAGWVAERQRPLRVFRVTPEEWPETWRVSELLGEVPIHISSLLVPLWIRGKVEGCVEVAWRPHHHITDQEEAFLEAVATQAAIAITNARLYQEKEQALRKVTLTAEALRVGEERYRALAENTHDLICELDREGRYTYLSPNYPDALGFTPEGLLGRSCFEFLHPEDLSSVRQAFAEGQSKMTFRLAHKNAEWRWIESARKDYRMRDGQRRSVFVFRDITDRKKIEEEQLHLQERDFQNKKLQSLGRLAGGVAHEFNNLLTPILGFTELSLSDVSETSETHQNLQEVLKAGKRAKALVQQILVFSRLQPQERQAVAVHAIAEKTLPLLHSLLPTTIELRYTNTSVTSLVKADQDQLQQVLMHLSMNAKDAMMDKGGVLEIFLTESMIDEALVQRYPNLTAGLHVQLTVRDSGGGIPAIVLPRIFDPFFTTKSVGDGSGLGLSIVHGIVTGHGGVITVDSVPGDGSTFTVYLPLVADHAEHIAA